jgi:probable HAF family extracellular repeat protein
MNIGRTFHWVASTLLAACGGGWLVSADAVQAAVPAPGSYAVYDLGTLGGLRSEAYDLNDDAQVTGYSYAGGPESYGFTWQNGVMRKLGAFPGGKTSTAFANVGGVAVGLAEGRVTNYTYWTNIGSGQITTNTAVSNYFKACRWTEGSLESLEGLMPGGGGQARAVNYGGVIAGYTGWTFTNQINTNYLFHVDRAVRWSSSGGAPTS